MTQNEVDGGLVKKLSTYKCKR